jgi:hypothetical protein
MRLTTILDSRSRVDDHPPTKRKSKNAYAKSNAAVAVGVFILGAYASRLVP